jgi:hypothetical protein
MVLLDNHAKAFPAKPAQPDEIASKTSHSTQAFACGKVGEYGRGRPKYWMPLYPLYKVAFLLVFPHYEQLMHTASSYFLDYSLRDRLLPYVATSASSLQLSDRFPFESKIMSAPTTQQNEVRGYTSKDWDDQKLEIARLYQDETLDKARLFMRQHHGLYAT